MLTDTPATTRRYTISSHPGTHGLGGSQLTACGGLWQGYATAVLPFEDYLAETPPVFRERVSALEETAFNAPSDTKRE